MGVRQTVISGMKAEQLRRAARQLNVRVDNYREKDALTAGLGKSRRATAEALLEFLSEKEVKQLCARVGVDSKGRRQQLITRLLRTTGTPTTRDDSIAASRRPAPTRKRARWQWGRGPELQFGHSTDRAGFTPAGIAAFSDLRPAAVVRELLQNSLDAALLEAKQPCARVRFERSACTLDEIPGIQNYRTAFRQALKEHTPSGSARPVVERLERTLRDEAHDVLWVTDNGVGLDGKRMSALLSDGVSAKGGNASGTFGNGHSVVIPASSLRYVLYGGLTATGQSFGAGQAVLASHRDDHDWRNRSGRGVYLESFKPSSADVPFTLAQGDAIPPMIVTAIDWIRDTHGHGAAVIIPAFNNFEHDRPLRETVFRAAAFNFFQAIHEGWLIVEVADSQGNGVLDAVSLPQVLAAYRDELRLRRSGAFLSGRKANEAYEALVAGDAHTIGTAQGTVDVRLLHKDVGRRSVSLCRNGMWITDELPLFQNAFSDRQPFQALILLSSEREDSFFELIREAETPLHDKLAPKQMPPDRRALLRATLREIRDAIAELVPASTEDVYSPPDILALQFDEVDGQGSGGRQPSFWGRVGTTGRRAAVRRRLGNPEGGGVRQGGDRTGSKNSDRRIVVEPIFRIASVPTGEKKRTVQVECAEDFKHAELRMFVDENVDATCDRQTRAQAATVLLSNVTVDGRPLLDQDLVRNAAGVVAAKLGSLAANTSILIETDYEIPAGTVQLLPGENPALRIEIVGTRSPSSPGGDAPDSEAPSDG